jgi:hypothetical protein
VLRDQAAVEAAQAKARRAHTAVPFRFTADIVQGLQSDLENLKQANGSFAGADKLYARAAAEIEQSFERRKGGRKGGELAQRALRRIQTIASGFADPSTVADFQRTQPIDLLAASLQLEAASLQTYGAARKRAGSAASTYVIAAGKLGNSVDPAQLQAFGKAQQAFDQYLQTISEQTKASIGRRTTDRSRTAALNEGLGQYQQQIDVARQTQAENRRQRQDAERRRDARTPVATWLTPSSRTPR